VKTAMMQWNKAYEQRLTALKTDEVKRAMNKYLKLENFLIIKAGDMTKVAG
jgi:zinc protease